jgi:hypothetical protein
MVATTRARVIRTADLLAAPTASSSPSRRHPSRNSIQAERARNNILGGHAVVEGEIVERGRSPRGRPGQVRLSGRMDERSQRIEKRFEAPMLVAAALVIPTVVIQETGQREPLHTIALLLDYAIWAAFLVELVVMVVVVPNRLQWLIRHPLEVIVVVLTPPFLLAALQPVRALRLLRPILRPLRLLRVFPVIRRLRELQKAVVQARAAAADLDGDEAGKAYARVLSPALDRAIAQMLRRAAATSVRKALEEAFGAQWAVLGRRSQELMIMAELLRSDLEEYSSIDPGFDFAVAVHAYSRTLENAVLEKLFEPLRDEGAQLPADTADRGLNRSLAALRRLRDENASPELGTMAFCLKNVGCGMAEAPENGFAALLDRRLTNRAVFCETFPSELLRYTEEFRNRAAHVERMTFEECTEARARLMEEPVRLLRLLVSSLR